MYTCEPIDSTRLATAYRYANMIHNKSKRNYANAYIGWLRNGAIGLEPNRGKLSAMAAQAVRSDVNGMRLWEGSCPQERKST